MVNKCALSANWMHEPRKFRGGICCGGHFAVTYAGELLYLRIILWLNPPNNFAKRELPFPRGLKSRTHIGYRAENHAVTIMCPCHTKSEGTITPLHTWQAIWPPPHSVNTGVKNRPDSPFKILWHKHCMLHVGFVSNLFELSIPLACNLVGH